MAVVGSTPLIKNEPDDYNFLTDYAFPPTFHPPRSTTSSLGPGNMAYLGIADDELLDTSQCMRYVPMQRQFSNPRSPQSIVPLQASPLHTTPALASLQLSSPPQASQWGSQPESLVADFVSPGKYAPFEDVHPAIQSQEAKRKRRRESHNLVERRRRDNINEKIHELSTLVPQHRLDDDKVRKATLNSPLSPILAPAMSPTMSSRRTASGSMSLSMPLEDKDKSPNKGDILMSAVSWTRDLMWALQQKYQREDELRELLASLGQPWPYSESDDDLRMRSELIDATTASELTPSGYSRSSGSGLVVPGYTDAVGREELPNPNQQPVRRHTMALGDASLPLWSGYL